MKSVWWGIGCWIFIGSQVWAEDLNREIVNLHRSIAASTDRLLEVRDRSLQARRLAAKKIEKMEEKVAELEREASRLGADGNRQEVELKRLGEEIGELDDELGKIASAILQYRRGLGVRLNAPQLAIRRSFLERIDACSEDGQRLDLLAGMLKQGAAAGADHFGVGIYPGSCLSKKGMELSGHFIQFGPICYFLSGDRKQAGLVGPEYGFGISKLVREVSPQKVTKLLEGEEVGLPIYVGSDRYPSGDSGWWQALRDGGPIMIPLLMLSLVCFVVVLFKAIDLVRLRLPPPSLINEIMSLLERGDIAAVRYRCRRLRFPADELLRQGMVHLSVGRRTLTEMLESRILIQLTRLERGLPVISITAAAAPLLGLLGTVVGMIHAFDALSAQGLAPVHPFSGGIGEALITTKYGLMVGIPALVIHALFSWRVKGITTGLEKIALDFIQAVPETGDDLGLD